MKKKSLLLVIMLSTIPLIFNGMATASIQRGAWINATMGEDPYYGRNVVAYKTGTTWNISISVYNDYSTTNPNPPPPRINRPVNITAIKVYFDWGEWYNFTFKTPVRMAPLEVKVFNVGNITPPLSKVPETWVYSYTVYIEYVTEIDPSPKMDWTWSGSNLAVMSEAHFDSFRLYNKLKNIMSGIPILPSLTVNSTEAQVLLVKAFIEYNLGRQYYVNGAFEEARTHLQNADAYITQALAAWNTRGTELENATLQYYNSLAEYYNSLANATGKSAEAELVQASAALNNSYGWIFFGIGWTLIGVGIIVYGLKKPKTA
ncbi:MAG: tetratricopeptide repeat protein [Candidatus Bathyarchaeia archaeon]